MPKSERWRRKHRLKREKRHWRFAPEGMFCRQCLLSVAASVSAVAMRMGNCIVCKCVCVLERSKTKHPENQYSPPGSLCWRTIIYVYVFFTKGGYMRVLYIVQVVLTSHAVLSLCWWLYIVTMMFDDALMLFRSFLLVAVADGPSTFDAVAADVSQRHVITVWSTITISDVVSSMNIDEK